MYTTIDINRHIDGNRHINGNRHIDGSFISCMCASIATLVFFTLMLSGLGFTISGIFVLVESKDALYDSHALAVDHLWIYVLVYVILLGLSTIGFRNDQTTTTTQYADGTLTSKTTVHTSIVGLGTVILSILIMNIYFNMDKDDVNYYENEYYPLYKYTQIVSIFHLILYSAMAVIFILYVLFTLFCIR